MSKKSSKSKDDLTYDVRDIVLAKLRGFPTWPAMIIDPETVPPGVAKERPTGKKQVFYCVRFFPVGDYSWVLAKDLSKLKRHEIESYISEPHKKNGDLLQGYQVALNPEKWEQDMEEKQLDEEETRRNEEEVDELDGEEIEEDDEKPAKPKKRKRDSDAAPKSKSKPKKEKDSSEPAAKKKKQSASEKPTKSKSGAKSKTLVESEDEGDRADEDDAGPSKKLSSPPAKKQKPKLEKEEDLDGDMEQDPIAQKVKDWRHRFQRGFLGKVALKDEDMPTYNTLFSTVEDYDMEVRYLQFSKIGKVMRHIAQLESSKIPRDEEYRFKDRAQALVNKWHSMIDKQNGANGTTETTAVNDAMAIDKTNGEMETNKPNELPLAADATTDSVDIVMDTKLDANTENHVNDAMVTETDADDEKGTMGDLTMSEA